MLSVDIKKKLGAFSLDVRFEAQNEVMAILGASGCGKSMTLKCIAGIEKPDEGRVVLDGRTLFDSGKGVDLPPQQRGVGYLFQSYALFPHMTVEQNIAAGIRGATKAERERRVREKLQSFYLCGMERKYPYQLSGGQQQRVALARILASKPRLLLLDEPFSALDSYLRWQLEQELSATLSAFPGTALFVSHNRDEVYRLCRSVCLVDNGRSQEAAPVKELFARPGTLCAALLTGCKNYSRITATGPHTVFAQDWGTELLCAGEIPQGASYVGVRAHYVSPLERPGDNAINCRVLGSVEDVFSQIITLRPLASEEKTDFSCLRMELSKAEGARIRPGDALAAYIGPGDLLLLR